MFGKNGLNNIKKSKKFCILVFHCFVLEDSELRPEKTFGRSKLLRTSTLKHEEELNASSILFDNFMKDEEFKEKSLLSQQSKQPSIDEESSSGYESTIFNDSEPK